ncbi:hypothetical protein J4E81_005613 [Alternaria sp. BMP 2799]|uniref:uncharacterized protein n=1 Tax=Alternaria conjuncta TaxID=181017 RepID=UPI002220C0DE|nr:uncharacterized protein J4E85_007356 [Alternaria conjuncta]KAI4698390.1 hypothetical protein J4E81_005613 [Alternaria sp. BMP 2799]KAI4925477.1 hypothetical protein J4E85_007356 [Alternaria conjuncta]
MIKVITDAPLEFRKKVCNIYCGDPSRNKALEITDETVVAMIEALPNLEHVRIDGAPKLTDRTLSALLRCDGIRAITLTTTRDQPNTLKKETLENSPWPPELLFFELSGQQLPGDIIDYFEYWSSEKRSATLGASLEIVYNFGPYYIFWRDGFPRWIQDYDFQKWGAWDPDFD